MEKQRLEAAEREYISDEMTAVMEEMGYDILGSREVIKKSGTKFLNELYDYGNGNAVNITYASDGKITMELGKMDSSDRIPDTSEKAVLVGTMTEFCSRFREIIMVSTPHSTYTNSAYQINLTIVLIWIVMAIAAFVWQQLKYFRFKKLIQLSMTEITDLDIIDYVDHYRQTVRIKRKVRLYQSN